MTTESAHSVLNDRPPVPTDDLAALHAREADRLLAYLCSSDRALGLAEAEAVSQQAFLEVRASWPGYGPFSRPEVYVFAAAQRISAGRVRASSSGDALTESAPDHWDRADVARLTVLQDSLDRLPVVPRQAVVLREMCGFSPTETAEIVGLPEPAVESARADALRTLVPMIESGTSSGTARRGPLSPEDFAALGRVLQHTDPRRIEDRQRFALSLGTAPTMTQAPVTPPGPPPAFGAGAPMPQAAPQPQSAPPPQQPPVQAQPQREAPPTWAQPALGGPAPGAEALFSPPGAASGGFPAGDGSAGGWMSGFGSRNAAADPSAPPTVSAVPTGRERSPLTGGLPLGAPAQQAAPPPPAAPTYPEPTYPEPRYTQPTPTYIAPTPTYSQPTPTYTQPTPTYTQPTPTYTQPTPTYTQPTPTYSAPTSMPPGTDGVTGLMPTNLRPSVSALDAPGFAFGAGGTSADLGTPIFDEISAWFATPVSAGPGEEPPGRPAGNPWAALRDGGWREANERAGAAPRVSGSTEAGLPRRAPGANMVPSAGDASAGMRFTREAPRTDPGLVRHRLDSFQAGVQTARQLRESLAEPTANAPTPPAPPAPPAPPMPAPVVSRASSGLPTRGTAGRPSDRSAARGPAADGPTGLEVQPLPTRGTAAGRADGGGGGEESATATGQTAARRTREGGFGVFYRDYLPHLLALLMIEGARPGVAAQLAQDAMSDAYREWASLEDPRGWTRQVALSAWSVQRGAPGSAAE